MKTMPECKEACPQLDKLEQEVRTLRDQNSEEHKEFYSRLNAIERTNAVQDERYKATMDKLDEISIKQDALGEKIGTIEAKPAKRWESLMGQMISLVAAAVIGVILGRIGL